jgi:methionyl-tRNA formyltransferase
MPFKIVVLTCDFMGVETALRLQRLEGIEVAAVVTSPHRKLPLRRRIRSVLRTRGMAGLLRIAFRKLRSRSGNADDKRAAAAAAGLTILEVSDLHDDQSLQALARLQPDLAVVDGTYILKPELFRLPRLGAINLHCGKVPEYRGSPPVFWEMFDGTPMVGITVHQVEERLDAGPVYSERTLSLDIAPDGDPVTYARSYWERVLRPAGIEMLGEVVQALAAGRAQSWPQPDSRHGVRRTPSIAEVQELRRRVRARRRAG